MSISPTLAPHVQMENLNQPVHVGDKPLGLVGEGRAVPANRKQGQWAWNNELLRRVWPGKRLLDKTVILWAIHRHGTSAVFRIMSPRSLSVFCTPERSSTWSRLWLSLCLEERGGMWSLSRKSSCTGEGEVSPLGRSQLAAGVRGKWESLARNPR